MAAAQPLTDEEFMELAGQVAIVRERLAMLSAFNAAGKTPAERATYEAEYATVGVRYGRLVNRLENEARRRVIAEETATTTTEGPNQ